MTDSNVIKLD